jgi:Lrp/AsnC family transcriptional regulator, leucine-responsive regulatory protein
VSSSTVRRPRASALEAAIRKLPFILDCYLVAGDIDYFLKVRVRDIADFNRLHGEQLIALPGVPRPEHSS